MSQTKRSYGKQVHLSTSKQLPWHEMARLAALADVDVRTVRKALRGQPLLSRTAQQVFQVLLDAGAITERDLGPDVVME